jgi:uncharacterized membrane protein
MLGMSQLTANRKTIRLFLVATATSFALIYGGHWLAYLYVHNKELNNKDEFINISLIDSLLLMPVISVVVGIFIGSLEQKNRWWVAGISLLPLLTSILYRSFDGGLLLLSCIYLFLSLLSSWFVSWWRHR